MRILLVATAVALLLSGCGSSGKEGGACRAEVRGGTAAQRTLVNGVVCARGTSGVRVRIAPAPAGLPDGTSELVIDAKVPALPASPVGRRAAKAAADREAMSWFAAVIAGAVRDKSERQQLPRVMFYELRFDAPSQPPELQTKAG